MKTLIFNGSPRKNADTAALYDEFINHLNGEHKIVYVYDAPVVYSFDTNNIPAKCDEKVMEDIRQLADFFNKKNFAGGSI